MAHIMDYVARMAARPQQTALQELQSRWASRWTHERANQQQAYEEQQRIEEPEAFLAHQAERQRRAVDREVEDILSQTVDATTVKRFVNPLTSDLNLDPRYLRQKRMLEDMDRRRGNTNPKSSGHYWALKKRAVPSPMHEIAALAETNGEFANDPTARNLAENELTQQRIAYDPRVVHFSQFKAQKGRSLIELIEEYVNQRDTLLSGEHLAAAVKRAYAFDLGKFYQKLQQKRQQERGTVDATARYDQS